VSRLLDLVARPHKLDPWSSTNIANRNAMNNSKLERLLNVTHSARDARESLKQVVPAIRTGININTHLGNLTLNGEDAEAVFGLNAFSRTYFGVIEIELSLVVAALSLAFAFAAGFSRGSPLDSQSSQQVA
jgi:hypothetical protein